MNVYVVVEGKNTEPAVYRNWIPLVNPSLTPVDFITDVKNDNFFIVSGYGYPAIFSAIDAAIADTNHHISFDRLVVSVDSEDWSYQERHDEIRNYVDARTPRVETRIVIQHFCFEAWALGNRRYGRQPKSDRLIKYKRIYDVSVLDPELLPALPDEELNRSQFAGKYLRCILREKRQMYSKSKPDVVAHPKYFEQLKNRMVDKSHISSFSTFLAAFS